MGCGASKQEEDTTQSRDAQSKDDQVKEEKNEEEQTQEEDASVLDLDPNELVTESWAVVMGAFTFEEVGKLFYDALFELAPTLRDTHFSNTDMTMQPTIVIKTIDTAVNLLHKGGELVPVIVQLGERHAGYGTEEAHYPVVGEALINVLAAGLGDKFTDDVKAAWIGVYTVIQTKMLEGHNSDKGRENAAAFAAQKAEEEKADEEVPQGRSRSRGQTSVLSNASQSA